MSEFIFIFKLFPFVKLILPCIFNPENVISKGRYPKIKHIWNWHYLYNIHSTTTVSALMLPHSWIEPQVMWKVQFLGFFLNKPPLFAQKDHFLRYFLNWPPPKNPYWKIEPWGSIRADTVSISYNSTNLYQYMTPLELTLMVGLNVKLEHMTRLYSNELLAKMLKNVNYFL